MIIFVKDTLKGTSS